MTEEETLADAGRIRDLFCTKQCCKQLSLEDDSTQVFEYAKEIADKLNQLLIMKVHYQRYLANEMLSDEELNLAQMYEEGGVNAIWRAKC